MTTRLAKEYKGRDDIEFIYLQTTFEGHSTNTFARAKRLKHRWHILRPIGQDGYFRGRKKLPYTMAVYRTGGTPWTIVIDHYGRIRFNDFSRSYRFHKKMLETLFRERKAAMR